MFSKLYSNLAFIPLHSPAELVAERKNRSLKEMTTCMLESKKLTRNLWEEAMNAAVYIKNRVPHSSLKGNTPFESYFGQKPDVSNLRVFGSTAWARIPHDKRKALQLQCVECLFIRYPDECLLDILMNLKDSSCWISRPNRSSSREVSSSMSLFRRWN